MQALKKGKRRPEKARFTLLLIPGTHGSVRGVDLPRRLAQALLCVGAGLACVAGFLLFSNLTGAGERAELHRLRDARLAQDAELRRIRSKAREVEERIRTLDSLDQRIRGLVGPGGGDAAPPAPASPSVGGPRGGRGIPLASRAGMSFLVQSLDRHHMALSDLERRLRTRLDHLESVPCGFPKHVRITSRFGVRQSPFGRGAEIHDGVDLDLPHGAPARAAAAGRVASVEREPAYGNVVRLSHGHGWASRYAHLSAFAVVEGDRVERGDVVGYVGSTGRSTGPHLHFMVLHHGQLRDPLQLLIGGPR